MDKIDFCKSEQYLKDVASVLDLDCDWNVLKNKTILITGATGLIGTLLKDMFLLLNQRFQLSLQLILLSRSTENIIEDNVRYYKHDINDFFQFEDRIDYIIHAASNTHPLAYSKYPIETITTNIIGLSNLLRLQTKNSGSRLLFLSSVEIYGDSIKNSNSGFLENDMGYLDCNTARAGYCESKRLGESLCQSYISERGTDCVIARLCRCFGPTLKKDDSKALSQFIKKGFYKENIVLKSEGNQYYSYIYACDAACALIFLLLNGECGEAYNIADNNCNITLKDLAKNIADLRGTEVVFELPSEIERKGYSKANVAILNPKKINDLGWVAKNDIKSGLLKTFNVLDDLEIKMK